jgi:hypothetical protein
MWQAAEAPEVRIDLIAAKTAFQEEAHASQGA